MAAQAFVTPDGHKLLLANKRNRDSRHRIARRDKAQAVTVDMETGDGPGAA